MQTKDTDEHESDDNSEGVGMVAVSTTRNGMPAVLRSLTEDELNDLERSLVRKLDWRLLLPLALMYFTNFLDRTNISTARVAGLQTDLHLRDTQYLSVLSICYVGYLVAQVPSNMLVEKLRQPAVYLAVSMIIWGVTSACTGLVHSYAALMVCRLFLGIFEAAFYPGALYYLSCWYTRAELAPRNSLFFSAQLFAGAFAGLLTAAITKGMDGVRGLVSWRWLFIITGVVTIALALLALPFMPALPENSVCLSAQERALAEWRLKKDIGDEDTTKAEESLSLAGLKLAIMDPKVWVFSVIAFGFTSFGSMALVLPSIIEGLGFGEIKTQCLTAPPYIIAAVVAIANAYWAGRSNQRFIPIVLPAAVTLVTLLLLASTANVTARYVAMCFMLAGNSAYPIVLTWLTNTLVRPASVRASALSIACTLATVNHVYNPFIFRDSFKPRYVVPTAIMAGFSLISILAATIMRQMLMRENAKLDAGAASLVESVMAPMNGSDTCVSRDASIRQEKIHDPRRTPSSGTSSESQDPVTADSASITASGQAPPARANEDRGFRYII